MSPITDYLSCAQRTAPRRSTAVKFSVITACRNASSHLPETVRTVVRAKRVEAGDRCARVLHRRRRLHGCDRRGSVRIPLRRRHFPFKPDTGLYDALVKGFAKNTGDLVTYLNAGDILHEHAFRIASQIIVTKE